LLATLLTGLLFMQSFALLRRRLLVWHAESTAGARA
jgi:hypothetical protein